MKNNKVSVKNVARRGRPAFQLVYPRGSFTVAELAKVNPGVCTLTVRQHIDKGIDTRFLKLLNDTVQTGKVGKPAFKYIRAAVFNGRRKAAKARRGNAIPVASTPEAPAVTVPIVAEPVAVQAPIAVEQAEPVLA